MHGQVSAHGAHQHKLKNIDVEIPRNTFTVVTGLGDRDLAFRWLDRAGERTLAMAVRRMGLSARAHDRILKVARTIADIGSAARVEAEHVAETVQYRSLDGHYWACAAP